MVDQLTEGNLFSFGDRPLRIHCGKLFNSQLFTDRNLPNIGGLAPTVTLAGRREQMLENQAAVPAQISGLFTA